jgi:hypothetical protein
MNQLKDVKVKARALVGDPDGDWADDAYLMPFVGIAYEGAINYLANTCAPYITINRDIPNVPQGTTDLTSLQVQPATGAQAAGLGGSPLLGLVTPLKLWFKQAGQPENNYMEAFERKNLSFVTPSNYVVGMNMQWEWRANKMFVTPLGFTADFLVKGDFIPPPLVEDDDVLQLDPLMANGMGFAVASLIGGERIAQSYRDGWASAAEQEWDNISARLVRKELSTTQRVGRIGGRGGGRRGCR